MADRTESLPAPSPDRKLHQAVLQSGFKRFPERKRNFELYKAATRGADVQYLPVKIDIENVSRCNFHCIMCQVSDWPKQQRAGDMSVADFKALVDEQYGLVEIKLQGMGEPLLAGDAYFEMIEYARARDIWVRSTVNGSLLHLNDNYKKLVDSDICEVQISIDGATRETYESVRRGGKFQMVSRNCRMLNDYARTQGKLRTRMWVVVQDANFHELEKFPELAHELGFERLTLSVDLNDWGQDSWRERNDQVDVQKQVSVEQVRKMIDVGAALGVETTFWHIDEKYVPGDPKRLCAWPFERVYVSSDMRVVPCCMVATPEVAEFGDARDLARVWTGDAMRAFRRRHLDGDIPDYCATCYQGK